MGVYDAKTMGLVALCSPSTERVEEVRTQNVEMKHQEKVSLSRRQMLVRTSSRIKTAILLDNDSLLVVLGENGLVSYAGLSEQSTNVTFTRLEETIQRGESEGGLLPLIQGIYLCDGVQSSVWAAQYENQDVEFFTIELATREVDTPQSRRSRRGVAKTTKRVDRVRRLGKFALWSAQGVTLPIDKLHFNRKSDSVVWIYALVSSGTLSETIKQRECEVWIGEANISDFRRLNAHESESDTRIIRMHPVCILGQIIGSRFLEDCLFFTTNVAVHLIDLRRLSPPDVPGRFPQDDDRTTAIWHQEISASVDVGSQGSHALWMECLMTAGRVSRVPIPQGESEYPEAMRRDPISIFLASSRCPLVIRLQVSFIM